MLNNFRTTQLTWDKATKSIYEKLKANASDENGRKLAVKIVNDGVEEDLSGATLSLYWETRNNSHDGLDAFTAIDASKGEFEIYYTTGMLSNVGKLNACLVLVDSVGRVVSDLFEITVTRGINNEAIESENSFTALTQALVNVQNLESNYAPKLFSLESQLHDKVGGQRKLKPEEFSDEAISLMTGQGTVNVLSIPQDESVTVKKLDKQIQDQLGEYKPQTLIFADRTYYDPTTFTLIANEGNARFEPIPVAYGDNLIIDELYDGKIVYLDSDRNGIELGYSGDITEPQTFTVTNPTAAYIGVSCYFGGKDMLTIHKYERYDISDTAAKVATIDEGTKLDVTSFTVPINHMINNGAGTYTREVLPEGVKFTLTNTSADSAFEVQIGEYVEPVYERLAYFAAEYEVVSATAPFTMAQSDNFDVPFQTSVGTHRYLNKGEKIIVQFKIIVNVPAGAQTVILFKHFNVLYQTSDTTNGQLTENLVNHVIEQRGWADGTHTILKPKTAFYSDNSKYAETAGHIASSWSGKKWTSYGDSITGQGGWQQVLVDRFGLNHTNLGAGGTRAAGNAPDAGWQDARINAVPDGTDIITVMFGTNDQSAGVEIGADDGNTLTYTGALGVIIRKLQTKFPMARIIVMGPPFRTDSMLNDEPVIPFEQGNERDMNLYADAAKGIARKFGLPFVDMWAEMGVNVINFKQFLEHEGWPVHLNENGKKRFASVMVGKFAEIEPIE